MVAHSMKQDSKEKYSSVRKRGRAARRDGHRLHEVQQGRRGHRRAPLDVTPKSACLYYRQTNYVNEDAAQARGFTKPPIVNFDWETARPVATSDQPKLTATKRHVHPNGEDMTNEQTVHKTMLQAREKSMQCEGTDMTILHSDLVGTEDTTLITLPTGEHGRSSQPCSGLTLATYLRDRMIGSSPLAPASCAPSPTTGHRHT